MSFFHSIYIELADQYKDMDPSSNVVKRNVLADHLREVIDILEQKVCTPFLRSELRRSDAIEFDSGRSNCVSL